MQSMDMKRWILCLAGVTLCAWTAGAEEPSRVKWIAPDEPFAEGVGKDRFYRRTFEVKAGLTNAVARWWFDDRGTLSVDGNPAPGGSCRMQAPADLTGRLKAPGWHVLAVRNANLAGRGGICLSLALAYADGTTDFVYTSGDWKCARMETSGWASAAFDDASWARAKAFDDALAGPWCSLADMTLLLPPDEMRAFDAERAARASRLVAVMKLLEKETKPVCRVVYEKGKSRFDIGGKLYETTFYNTSESWNDANRKLRRQAAGFRDAGVHLYGVGINTPTAWKADGSIDFQPAEDAMRSALAIDPEARFFFSINTVLPPRWWAAANLDELVGYANGSVNLDERECLKNCAAASAASLVWRRDAGAYYRRVVEHLEASPFAKRIFAYRVDWGINHEWHYYGMRGYLPDSGKAMTAAFRTWLWKAYGGDVAALRRAWRDPAVTFEAAMTPSKDLRLRKSAGMLRDPVLDRAAVDYERCHAETLKDLLLFSNRTVKEACGGRALVGNYAGYFFGMPETAEGWHLANDAILDSPYIDFQCSPQVYGRDSRQPGGVQYARCLLEGLRRRGKVGILEADNSTTFSGTDYNHWSTDTESDIALLARDFVQTLCWGCGFWYFDFGQGWYADPAFDGFFKEIFPIRALDADCRSVSDVLVVGDYESVMFSNVDWPVKRENLVITRQVNELGAAGAPFDSASFADLASGTLKDYKVYLFPNLHYATPEKRAVVERLRAAEKRLVWIGAPGSIGPEGPNPAGLAVPEDKVFAGPASRADLRELYRAEGVHVYNSDDDAAVYANASYVALHNANAGRRTIHLPRAAKVTELYPEKRSIGDRIVTISFDAKGPATTLFRVE